MIKTIEELNIIEGAEIATPVHLLSLPNSNNEPIGEEIDRIIGAKEIYTIEDLSEEARKVLKI